MNDRFEIFQNDFWKNTFCPSLVLYIYHWLYTSLYPVSRLLSQSRFSPLKLLSFLLLHTQKRHYFPSISLSRYFLLKTLQGCDHKSRQIAQYCIRIINHGRSCSLHLFRQRFDSNGRGRGMEGRRDTRDLPILWPTPSSNGFLLTSPSAVPVGREGATSPLSPRQNIFRIIILHFQKSEFNPHRLN